MTTTLPPSTITACERAAVVIDASHPTTDLVTRDLITVVLRLYRQGNPDTRTRCLDLIDQLIELNTYDVAQALKDER